ncbi:MAG: polyprenyl synthetase family protein [Deltaproteobacteria bacterium]|nr:polyprenyl synthetase family protein [Deltaproteobacteria bacterium]
MHSKAKLSSAVPLAPHLLVAAELQRVEQRLSVRLQSREPLLNEIGHYLISAGGKRVRPAVALLVFRACGGEDTADIIDIATALELIHSASLLHDDIIDGGETRRGKASAFHRFGLADSLVAGDFLFGQAFALCGRFEEKVITWATDACISLTEGEVMQGRFRHNPQVTQEDYLEIISRKTASLFAQGARMGAYIAGAPAAVVESMASCGFCVGMAFQIVDDLLDIEGDGDRTGKPTGADLKDGNPSLPLVLAIALDPEVKRVFQKKRPTGREIELALERVRRSGVLAEVQQLAHSYGQQALSALEPLEPSPYYDSLAFFIHQLVDRTA